MRPDTEPVGGAVAVRDLVVRYGPAAAVRGASFTVAEGECFGLLGPNGAGKTSILRALVGLRPAAQGAVRVLGHDPAGAPRVVRSLLGYVPQAVSADASLTGRENATLFAKLYGVPRARRRSRIDLTLELMGLGEAAGRLVQTYSGGMVRRLEIACALLSRPPVLLLDEPTLGLDPRARRSVWDHLRDQQADRGMSILVTTHYMEEAEQQCDRVAVLHGGRILAEGTPSSLRASVGPAATLEDVFIALTGDELGEPEPEARTARRFRGGGGRGGGGGGRGR